MMMTMIENEYVFIGMRVVCLIGLPHVRNSNAALHAQLRCDAKDVCSNMYMYVNVCQAASLARYDDNSIPDAGTSRSANHLRNDWGVNTRAVRALTCRTPNWQ